MNSPANIDGLQALQDRFAIIDLVGDIRVVDKHQIAQIQAGNDRSGLSLYKKADASLLMKRYLEGLPVTGKPERILQDFWVSPQTHMYTGVAFSPAKLPPEILNYWIGPTALPAQGDWRVLHDFLFEVICAGDAASFEYLTVYLAHMLQRPGEKPGVMVVMLGAQGIGKGTFFQLLAAIWGRTTVLISDVEQVVGKFNSVIERNLAICMDEALFHGDKKSMERMKSLITEPTILVEQKHQPSRSIDSYHRFFAASNNDHFGHLDRDDRRMLFLRVSDARKGDEAYFGRLFEAIEDPNVVGAMVFDLQRLDLSGVNVRSRPITTEHVTQKLLSLTGFERYWYEVLLAGELDVGHVAFDGLKRKYSTALFISTRELKRCFENYDRQAGRHGPIQEKQIALVLKRFCASAKSTRFQDGSGKVRGFKLPSLTVARKEFEAAIGAKAKWI